VYLGTLIFNKWDHKNKSTKYKPEKEWVRVENAWEPIITKEEVNIINSSFEKKEKSIKTPRINEYALTGYLTCGICGCKVAGTTSGRKGGWRYYRCNKSRDSGPVVCGLRMIPQKQMENLVLADFQRHFMNEDSLKDLIQMSVKKAELKISDAERDLVLLKQIKQEAENRKENLLNAIESGSITMSDVSDRIRRLNVEIAATDKKINDARTAIIPPVPAEKWDLDAFRLELLEFFKSDYPSPLTLIAKHFIESIKVYNDHLDIDYRWSPATKRIGLLRLITSEDKPDDVCDLTITDKIDGAEDIARAVRTSRDEVPVQVSIHFPDIELSSVVCF
jgi:hypothetical protein